MNGQTERQRHGFQVTMRKEMHISGVKEVESFDEGAAVLLTENGEMTVEGRDLHVEVLDTERGVVSLSGRIDGVFYSSEESGEKRGFLGKLFH